MHSVAVERRARTVNQPDKHEVCAETACDISTPHKVLVKGISD